MHGLKHKADYIKGWRRTYGDFRTPDPQSHLTDEEIGLDAAQKQGLINKDGTFPMPKELAA